MVKKGTKKKVKKNVQTAVAHIQSTFNNTVITIADPSGNAPVNRASRDRASRLPSQRRRPRRRRRRRRWNTACER
jgi:hypothetical protein